MTENIIADYCKACPGLEIRDVLKYIYQSSCGCEHLLTDEKKALAYIEEEYASMDISYRPSVVNLNGDWCRVDLNSLRNGLLPSTLCRMFVLSAAIKGKGREHIDALTAEFLAAAADGTVSFAYDDVKAAVTAWQKDGCPPVHHSEKYRELYRPAYRVIHNDYAQYLPLLTAIDKAKTDGRCLVAIDGGCASGKTTLAKRLGEIYDCCVIHMDDFFLRPEQRTAERYAQPGGNIDRERFLEEVLAPLREGRQVQYRRFDCGEMRLLPPVALPEKKLCIIEGVYSLHPELEKFYDIKAFIDVDMFTRMTRIQERNSSEMAERFFNEWIPLEEKYFSAFNIKGKADIIL